MRRLLSDAETTLWRCVVANVEPVESKRMVAPTLPESLPSQEARARYLQESLQQPPALLLQPVVGTATGNGRFGDLNQRTVQKLRRGRIPVEGRIDLHGMTQAQAYAALLRFIGASRAMGRRIVLVITGKGCNPDARRPEEAVGVLRRSVPRWLETPSMNQHVTAVKEASAVHGGTGALYVLLRCNRGVKAGDGPSKELHR